MRLMRNAEPIRIRQDGMFKSGSPDRIRVYACNPSFVFENPVYEASSPSEALLAGVPKLIVLNLLPLYAE